jgi:hypothetical protein
MRPNKRQFLVVGTERTTASAQRLPGGLVATTRNAISRGLAAVPAEEP